MPLKALLLAPRRVPTKHSRRLWEALGFINLFSISGLPDPAAKAGRALVGIVVGAQVRAHEVVQAVLGDAAVGRVVGQQRGHAPQAEQAVPRTDTRLESSMAHGVRVRGGQART